MAENCWELVWKLILICVKKSWSKKWLEIAYVGTNIAPYPGKSRRKFCDTPCKVHSHSSLSFQQHTTFSQFNSNYRQIIPKKTISHINCFNSIFVWWLISVLGFGLIYWFYKPRNIQYNKISSIYINRMLGKIPTYRKVKVNYTNF